MLAAIDRFCLKPLQIPKNEGGALGIIGFLLILPFSLFAALTGRYDLLLAWLALSSLLVAPYFLLNLVIFFIPIIVAISDDRLESWIEKNVNYTVFTFLCILLGVGFMLWKLPQLEVSKRYEDRNKQRSNQAVDTTRSERPEMRNQHDSLNTLTDSTRD